MTDTDPTANLESTLAVEVPPQTLSIDDVKPGMVVVFVDHNLNTHPACWVEAPHETNGAALAGKTAMVVAVEPQKPGKVVALCFKDEIPFGHSCDGRVPDKHGAYALPGHLYTPETYAKHKLSAGNVATQQVAIDTMLKSFLG